MEIRTPPPSRASEKLAEDPTQSPRFSPYPSSPSPARYPASPLPDQVNGAAVSVISSSSSHEGSRAQFHSPSPLRLKRSADQMTAGTSEQQLEAAKKIFKEIDQAQKFDINDALRLKNLFDGIYRAFQLSQPSPVQDAIHVLASYKKNPENLHTGLQLIHANYPHALTAPLFVSELNRILLQPFSVLFTQDFIQFLDNLPEGVWAAWGLVKIIAEAHVDSPDYGKAYSPRTPSAQSGQVNSTNFYVHKEKLTSRSDYFNRVFIGGFSTAAKGANETTLHNMHRDSFAEILKWCYSDKIEITEDNGSNLLFTVEFFAIPALKQKVENFYFNEARKGTVDLIQLYELGAVAQSQRIMHLALLNMLYARSIRKKRDDETKIKITQFLMQPPKFNELNAHIADELKKITEFSTEAYPNIIPNRTFLGRLKKDTGIKKITIVDDPKTKYVTATLLVKGLNDSKTLENLTIETGNSGFKADFLTAMKLPILTSLSVGEIVIEHENQLANFKSNTLEELSLTAAFSHYGIMSQTTSGGVRADSLQHLMGNLPKLRELAIGNGILAPDDLLILNTGSSRNLDLFYLQNHALTDDHLAKVATIARLKRIHMGLIPSNKDNLVTDDGLRNLADAYPEQRLTELSLLCTQAVTDAGVSALSGIETLTSLSLIEAAVTGTCFLELKKLNLKELSLYGCTTLKTDYLGILASSGINKIDLRGTNLTSNELATYFQPHGYTGFESKILVLNS